jgi:selenocysteine-specific elongation factor
MLSGAYGLDLVLLVLDAKEGIQPQTKEHLDIIDLLGISSGIVVVTKKDLVSEAELQKAIAQAAEVVKGTSLEGSPVLPVSAVSGEGLDQLKSMIVQQVNRLASDRLEDGVPRLNVDRAFAMSGFGAVVTGTLIGGALLKDQRVRILPQNLQARIRSIQVHNEPSEHALSGQRTALNLSGVEKSQIERGSVVCPEEVDKTTANLDVSLRVLESFPRILEDWTRVRFYCGTAELFGRVVMLVEEALLPGDKGYAQIRLESPVVAFRDDKFIIRDFSAQATIGGGRVINPFSPKHKRFSEETKQLLQEWSTANDHETLKLLVNPGGDDPAGRLYYPESDLIYYLPYAKSRLGQILQALQNSGEIIRWSRGLDKLISSKSRVNQVEAEILERLKVFHQKNPRLAGENVSQLRLNLSEAKGLDELSFDLIIDKLLSENKIAKEGNLIRLISHQVAFSERETHIKNEIEKLFFEAGISTPTKDEVISRLRAQSYPSNEVEEIFYALVRLGLLLRIGEGYYVHAEVFKAESEKLISYLRQQGQVTVVEFKDLANTTRKYAVPFLEYCDTQNITIRQGNFRRLSGKYKN